MFALVSLSLYPFVLMSAFIGVLLWVWIALLSPNDLLTGFMAAAPVNKVIAISTLLIALVNREKKDLYVDKIGASLIAFGLVATVSWAGSLVDSPDGDDLYQKLIKELVLAFAICALINTRLRIHLLVFIIAVSFGFLGVKEGALSIISGGGHKIIGSGSIGDNNSLATTLLMISPLLIYLARYSAVPVVRFGFVAVLVLSVVAVIMTFSRGGFLGLLVLGFLLWKNSRNRLAGLLLIALIGIGIYALAPEAWFERLETIETADEDSSFMGRVIAWKVSLLMALDHPFFGAGMHAVQRVPVWFAYRPSLPLLAFIPTPPSDDFPRAAHSIYFEVLGDLGFTGLMLFLALLGMSFRACRQIARLARLHPSQAWAADLAQMLQVSLVVYVVTAAALSMAYFELIYILFALASRCLRTVRQSIAEEAAVGAPQVNVVWRPQTGKKDQPLPGRKLVGTGAWQRPK